MLFMTDASHSECFSWWMLLKVDASDGRFLTCWMLLVVNALYGDDHYHRIVAVTIVAVVDCRFPPLVLVGRLPT